MTTDQVLLGVALILVLAVGSQILASRVHIPALIVLLPSGFVAGALTDVVNPQKLLGSAYQPLVSLAVAVILYDAGRALSLSRLQGHKRRVVRRLLIIGVPLTGACGALLTAWLLGMSSQAALMIGAILVVSGPTVVGPLLNHVRPADRLQHILAWEGSLVDPIGGILGALVFHGVVAGREDRVIAGLAHFSASLLLGLLGAAVGTGLLWLALNRLRLGETLGTLAQLAVVIGVAAVCDAIRDDSGLFAAVVMGLALANIKAFDISGRQPFFETLVQLIIGVLFVAISATVTPASLRGLVLPVLGVTAGLVLVVRPLVAYLSTLRTDVPTRQRAFIGWMAPRGIVAAATAATFGPSLVSQGFAGADKILPATFLVIVMTVTLYGLTAAPAARLLKVIRTAQSRPLLVGGQAWVLDLARTLRHLGLEVVLWAGRHTERQAIRDADLELAPGELLSDVNDPAAQIEGVTAVLLLTDEDDFNNLAATLLQGSVEGPVYRLAPAQDTEAVSAGGGPALFGPGLTRDSIIQRYAQGQRITVDATAGEPLFRVRQDGSLHPVTHDGVPEAQPGDTVILLADPA
ncbi:NhaP-type Na+/H+ or K+/H+ antiporter [Hamadaea flava]|uniref:Cation:proton antiporter n=1 Tax=Hamadaea flava TaxID=1742688 RepID=A0ABV8LYG9_9ACTN|nr:cation:proton antiporter [Hamadaea flava]MCP2322193.1 NhaP-type Na+/H+ or K+/H+ antiporter [Hamadaea flava]